MYIYIFHFELISKWLSSTNRKMSQTESHWNFIIFFAGQTYVCDTQYKFVICVPFSCVAILNIVHSLSCGRIWMFEPQFIFGRILIQSNPFYVVAPMQR